MDPYLSYEEYQHYGGTLSEDAFPLAEFRARKRIDYLTDCRVQAMAAVPEEVKLCMTEWIKADSVSGVDALADNPRLVSFSTDGYSESYGSAAEQAAALQRQMDALIRDMLYGVTDDTGTPLLYRGLAP